MPKLFKEVFKCILPPIAPEPNTEELPPWYNLIFEKLKGYIDEKSAKPLALELIGIPFHKTKVWELVVPLKEGVANAP